MKLYTKNIFSALGFELRRLKSPTKILKDPITKNATIELIGPSGVGKSKLCSDVRKILQHKWNIGYPYAKEARLESNNQLDELYRHCVNSKSVKLFERECSFDRYVELMSFFIKRAKEDRQLKLSGLLSKGGWLLDDSFCHAFTVELINIIEDKKIDDCTSTLKSFFKGRNFVLLNADDNWMLRNLRNRQNKNPGAGNDWLSIYGENDIIEHVRKSFKQKRKLVDYSSQYGAFSYEINISNGYDDALKSLIDIERKVSIKRSDYA